MTRKRTNDEFLEDVYKLVGSEYTFLDKYINNRTNIRVRHNKCGLVYSTRPYSFLNKGARCPKCGKVAMARKLSLTTTQFTKRVFETYGTEYKVLGTYTNSKTKIKVRHNICNKDIMIIPENLLAGHGCNVCAQKIRDSKRKMTNDEFTKKVESLVGKEYTFLKPYGKNAHIPIPVRHNICGNIYEVRPYNFIYNNRRCPYCNRSNGELFIKEYLVKHSIGYEAQKIFSDCKDKRSLSYDFYVPEFNTLIEYQGVQHYQPIEFFGKDYFEIQKKHDSIKRNYAEEHKINLLEISYRKYNQSLVSQTLTQYFNGVKRGNLNQN